jgi:hypothetical protein
VRPKVTMSTGKVLGAMRICRSTFCSKDFIELIAKGAPICYHMDNSMLSDEIARHRLEMLRIFYKFVRHV